MQQVWDSLTLWFSGPTAHALARAGLILGGGYLAARLLARWVASNRLNPQARMILRRIVTYSVFVAAVVLSLRELGLRIGTLLGAAGLLTVAVGFAAKTSISNLISGLFLIGEHPFSVGDAIQVGQTTGEVLSVDLMSTKLRTFDNRYVRIPNESLLSKEVTNLSHFPIRRYDLTLSVSYQEDLQAVKRVLDDVADRIPTCLTDPTPLFIFQRFGDSGLEIQYSVWGVSERFLDMRNDFARAVKEAFERDGIDIPYPHRAVIAAPSSDPLPVRVVDSPA